MKTTKIFVLIAVVLLSTTYTLTAQTKTDVTSAYLSGCEWPFPTTGVAVKQGTAIAGGFRYLQLDSPWITEGSVGTIGTDYTGFHIEVNRQSIAITIGQDGSLGSISNAKVYQTVTLPKGHWQFQTKRLKESYFFVNQKHAFLVAAKGVGLPDTMNISSALDTTRLTNFDNGIPGDYTNFSVSFTLDETTEVSLGVVTSQSTKTILTFSKFTLYKIDDTISDVSTIQLDKDIYVRQRMVVSRTNSKFEIYTVDGRKQRKDQPLQPGYYIVKNSDQSIKVSIN